ncbi:MAG TPA: RidA family protein [Dermatophilaceae bacterium]|nr:RidA family protein [Dermatophilaceae bacterium]
MSRALNPATVPAVPYYSQGISLTRPEQLVLVSGQVGVSADGTVAEGITEQTQQAVANVLAVVQEAGLQAEHIAKLTIYLTDPANIEPFMAAAGGALPSPPPATTLLLVSGLASPDLLIEIEAIAAA